MKRIVTILFVLFAYINALSQERMTVGEVVSYRCMCLGQEWIKGTVERIGGGNVRVRFGNLDNQIANLPENSPLIRRLPKPEDPQVAALRVAFAREVASTYRRTVGQFAPYYDPQFEGGGGLVRPEEWQKAMNDLAELDTICRSKYLGVTDFTDPTYARPGSVDYRFGTWCTIAAKRSEIEPKVRAGMAKQLVNLGYTEENLNFGFNEPDNPLRMETQQMIWERDRWRTEKIAWLKPKYAQYGAAVPADVFDAAFKRADDLRSKVDRDGPGRSYKQPKYHDAAIESFMKGKFAAQYPGAQVVKIGLDYTTWVKRQSLTYVASDDYFNYYRVNYNSYKRGTALLKIPGRPLCQTQDWVVGLDGGKLVAVAVGGSGTFMRCE